MPILSRLRFWLAALLLIAVAVANLLTLPETSLWRENNGAFRTAEIIQDPPWVKGTATLLATQFDSVRVSGLGEGQESLLFDNELAQIYAIETDSSETAIDLSRYPGLETLLAERTLVRFEFETFCRVAESQYCPLLLVWREEPVDTSAQRVHFETVRVAPSKFALIESSLLVELATELALDLSERVPR